MIAIREINKDGLVLLKEHIGQWLRFGGHGILDGCKGQAVKSELYKLVSVDEHELILKAYRARRNSMLPEYRFNQEVQIFDAQEFKRLAIYV